MFNDLSRDYSWFPVFFRMNPEAMAIIDPQGYLLHINSAYTDLLGYGEDELVGWHWDDLSDQKTADGQEAIFGKVFQPGGSLYRIQQRHKRGYRVSLELNLVSIPEGEGFYVALLRNFSEWQKEFLVHMSHEIRTPLNSIMGYAEILGSRRSIQGEDKQFLQRIQESGNVLGALIEDFLSFSQSGMTDKGRGSREEADEENLSPPRDSPLIKKNAFRGRVVFIVEDDDVNRLLLMTMLEDLGISVKESCNGQEVLELLEQPGSWPELIFMDMNMPIMGGLEAAEAMRKKWEGQLPPLVLLTGADHEKTIFDGYLQKPYSQGDLIQVLERFLGNPASALESTEAQHPQESSLMRPLSFSPVAAELQTFKGENPSGYQELKNRLTPVLLRLSRIISEDEILRAAEYLKESGTAHQLTEIVLLSQQLLDLVELYDIASLESLMEKLTREFR